MRACAAIVSNGRAVAWKINGVLFLRARFSASRQTSCIRSRWKKRADTKTACTRVKLSASGTWKLVRSHRVPSLLLRFECRWIIPLHRSSVGRNRIYRISYTVYRIPYTRWLDDRKTRRMRDSTFITRFALSALPRANTFIRRISGSPELIGANGLSWTEGARDFPARIHRAKSTTEIRLGLMHDGRDLFTENER